MDKLARFLRFKLIMDKWIKYQDLSSSSRWKIIGRQFQSRQFSIDLGSNPNNKGHD